MSPEALHREAGVGLVAAVFVIVILALLGTALVRLATTEQASVNREFASTKAFFAAESARQWGVYQVVNDQSPTGAVFSGTLPSGLQGCGNTAIDDFEHFATVPTNSTIPNQRLYRLRVSGVCFQNTQEETRRTLEVRFWDWE